VNLPSACTPAERFRLELRCFHCPHVKPPAVRFWRAQARADGAGNLIPLPAPGEPGRPKARPRGVPAAILHPACYPRRRLLTPFSPPALPSVVRPSRRRGGGRAGCQNAPTRTNSVPSSNARAGLRLQRYPALDRYGADRVPGLARRLAKTGGLRPVVKETILTPPHFPSPLLSPQLPRI
jgi:hypothetical protein